MFNKRENESEGSTSESHKADAPAPAKRSAPPRNAGGTAMIGPSINVDGKLLGDEDLVIEGKVKGTVELKKNSVTIGNQGNVQADVYAHSIFVDGQMDGNLVASEQVVIRKSARVKGSIAAPRVSLEDGAQFNGSIDMDTKSETQSKAFSGQKSSQESSAGAKTESTHSDSGSNKSGSEAGKQASL